MELALATPPGLVHHVIDCRAPIIVLTEGVVMLAMTEKNNAFAHKVGQELTAQNLSQAPLYRHNLSFKIISDQHFTTTTILLEHSHTLSS